MIGYTGATKIVSIVKLTPYLHGVASSDSSSTVIYVCLLHDEAIHQRWKVVNILYIDHSINIAGALGLRFGQSL